MLLVLIRSAFRGGSRMISKGVDLIILPYLIYVFGLTGLSKQCRPDQTPQNAASDQGLLCLPLIQQVYTHSYVVKYELVEEKNKGKCPKFIKSFPVK